MAGESNKNNITGKILLKKRTLTDRVGTLEANQKRIETNQKRILKYLGLNKKEVQK